MAVAAVWVVPLSAAVAPAGAAAGPGAFIHVATDGHDTPACGSAADPCATIPYAYGKAADGDTIQVAAGTYTLADALVITRPGIRMLGAMAGVNAATRTPGGGGETVITGSARHPTYGLFFAAADGVTIDGFTFQGNLDGGGVGTSESFSGYTVENNIVANNVVGLYADSDGRKPSLFSDNFFFADDDPGPGSGNGVFTYRPLANATFTGNKFRDNNNAPINIAGSEVPGGSHDITIAGNDMDGEFGVTLVAVSRVLITRNQMTGGWNAVQVSGACHDITITHNVMNGKTAGGVLLFTGFAAMTNTGITIEDNTIDHTATMAGRYGIEVSRSSGVLIRRNFLQDSGEGAIGFTARGQAVPSQAATIEQNTITGSGGPGITVAPGTYTGPMAVHFNRIVDNGPGQGIVNDDPAAAVSAAHNWWGCNSMPHGAGCDHLSGTAAAAIGYRPWLVLRLRSVPADILAGQAAALYADLGHNSASALRPHAAGPLRPDSAGAPAAGPFFAPVFAFFSTTHGHLAHGTVLTTADLTAHGEWPAGQPRPRQICAQIDNQEVCLDFAALPEVSLHVTKTAVPNPAQAGQPVTFTITISNSGPADAFGVTVDDGLAPLLAGFTWTCTATAAPSQCSSASGTGSLATTSADIAVGGTITYRLTGVLPAGAAGQVRNTVRILPPHGTTDHGCAHGCSASVTVLLLPAVPVTG